MPLGAPIGTPAGAHGAAGRRPGRSRLRPGLGLGVLAELVVFLLVADAIGVGATILLTLATSALGCLLLARQGTRALRDLQERARTRRPAGEALGDAGLVAVGGLLMVLPGFIGDVLGLACLLPGTRVLVRRLVARLLTARVLAHLPDRARGPVHVTSARSEGPVAGGGPVVHVTEGEVVEGELLDGPAR